jgi:hypothetical protein
MEVAGSILHDVIGSFYSPGIDSTFNRNEYQESSWIIIAAGRRLGLTTSPPSVSQLYKQCGSHDVSQPYGPPEPVTGLALLAGLLT